MKIGFFLTGALQATYEDLLHQVRLGEEAGFDAVWLRDRHFHQDFARHPFPSPFVVASFLAASSKRLRLGIGCKVLPLDHPLHVAEDAATVDVLSGGRLELGVARGGEHALCRAGFGIPDHETRGRFEESLEILLQAWTQPTVVFQGKYYQVPEVPVFPKPVQSPHPPLFVGGRSPQTIALAAVKGFSLIIPAAQRVSDIERTLELYFRLREEAGLPADTLIPINRFLYVAESNEQARAELEQPFMAFMFKDTDIREYLFLPDRAITYEKLLEEVAIVGDPDTCLRKIQVLNQRLGLRYLICTFNYHTLPHAKSLHSMALFAQHILPHLCAL